MNRNEYMKRLGYRLRRLPKEDFDRAMEYFTEYFEEAGPENEQQAIEDLGAPEAAADQIVRDMAFENAREKNTSVKRGFSTVWIGILAIFAAPVGLPLAFAAAIVVLAFLVVIVAIIFAIAVSAFFRLHWFQYRRCLSGCGFYLHLRRTELRRSGSVSSELALEFLLLQEVLCCKWFLNQMTRLLVKWQEGKETC